MNKFRTTSLALAIAAVAALAGCDRPATTGQATTAADEAAAKADESRGFIGRAVDQGIAQARKELHEGNLVIGGEQRLDVSAGGWSYMSDNDGKDLRPRAEITPQGDLLVEGKAVAVTPAQRKLLLAYRDEVIEVADAGLAIGSKGADLAGKAVGEAIGAIFGGDTKAMEQRVEAEADKLKQEAKVICTRLPALLAAQDSLAASLPAFQPYATMTREDVDNCMDDLEDERPSR